MALKFTRKPSDYISETAYMYDVAQTSQYFDKSVYESLVANGDNDAIETYLYGIAGARDKTVESFNQHDYKYLSDEDKASYTLTLLHTDPNSDEYKQAMEYFDYKVQEGIDKETYESLNGFERTMASVGGIIGNAVNEMLLGTIEGLVDLGAVLVGQKDWAATDFTGVGENREKLQRFSRAYTYLDKNKVWGVVNDVVTGVAQMVPMFIPYAGPYIYFASMAGNTAADAVRANPDIDYLSLIGYTAAVTGVEFATEKISAGILGGSGNVIDNLLFKSSGKGLTKVGQKAAGNWISRIGVNFLSEGLEESVAEFADTALFNVFIAQGNDSLRKAYSVEDILYAGLVGGLIGGVMEGGRISTTQRLGLTKDGRVISLKEAQKNKIDITTELTKTQSLTLSEQLSQASAFAQTDAIADLKSKYPNLSLQEIQQLHPEEYEKAVAKNEKLSSKMTEVILGLNRVYQLAGEDGFKRATDLANGVFEVKQKLLANYVAKATGTTQENRDVENAVKKIYGENTSFTVNDSLTAEQQRFKQNMKNKYGKNVYFGNLGEINGNNQKIGLTIDENTMIIDSEQMGEMSEQEFLNKIVKEELVHSLQFLKGVITPRLLLAIYHAMGDESVAKQKLDEAYSNESALTKLSEAQAKAVAEVLLFDDLTVSKMFYTEYSTLNKVYRFFKNLKTKIEESKELRSQKGKIKYNTLLKSMKMYRDIAAQLLGTAENVEKFIKDYPLTELEEKQLRDAYLENPDIGPIEGYERAAAFAQMKTNALYDFLKKKGITTINYHEKGFSQEFIDLMGDVAPSVTTIKEMLNENTSENETAIGTTSATNLIIEFLYQNNKNIKSIEDVTALTEKDKKGYSPLAYSYVYATKHSPKEGVKITYISEEAEAAAKKAQDPTTPHTKQEVRFDVALKMENGKRVYDKDKLKLKEFELKEAQQIIDDAIAQNVLNTILLDSDFDYSMNATKQVFKKAESSTKYAKNQFKEVQFSKVSSEEGDELGGEEFVVDEASNVENIVLERMGESVEDTATFMDNLPKIIETYKQDFETWLLRSGASEKQGNELDKIKRVVDNIKALEKSEEKIKISAANRDLINQITKPEFLIESVENVVNAENSKTIKKKLENNKNLLVNMYKTDGYNKIHAAANVKDAAPVNATEESSVENVIKEDTEPKKQTVRELFTDKETGELRLPERSPEEISEARKNIKNTTAMANVMIDDTFKSNVDLAKKIKSLFTLTKESQYQGDGDESNRLYFRAAKKIVSENAALFVQITPKNYYEVRKALIVDGDKQARVALEMVDEYAKIHKHKFASIEQQIEEIHHEEITSAARRMGLWSNTLKEAAPISSFVDGLKSEGVDYNVDDKTLNAILAKHNEKLKTPHKYLIELKSNYDSLTKELENMANEQNPSPERQVEISQDLVRLDNEIMVLENGSALEIMDYYVNNSDSLTQRHAIQQEAFEAIFESAIEMDEELQTELETNRERNKKYKDYPELFPKLNKKIKKIVSAMEHFRITAMLSSPITWVRNAINNRLLYGLAKSTDFIESKINETAKFKKLYSHPGQYKLVTSASEKAEYKQTRTYLMDNYYDYIFAWLGSTQNKMDTSSVSAEISRTKTKVQQKTGNAIAKAIGAVEDIIYKNLETGKLGDRPMTTKYMLEGMANILTANKAKYVESIKALYGDADRINRSKSLSAEQKKKLITALDTQTPTDLFEAISIIPGVFEEFLQISSSRALETFLKNDTVFSRLLRNVSQQNIFAKVAIGLINPFYKVGGNVLAMAWKYSPMNFINAIGKLKRAEMVTSEGYVGKYTGTETAEASRAFAQSTVGSALWIAGIIAAALGWIDVDEDEYMGPYVNFLGVKIGLSDLAPAMTTFSVGAVMMKSWKDKKIFDMDLFLRVMYSNTLLGNVENIFKYSSEMDFFSSLSINYITSYIPAVFKLTAKIFDDGIKDKSGNWMSKLWKTILASLPGVSRTVSNKINPYTGEQQTRYGTDNFILNLISAMSPVEVSFESKNMSAFEKEALALDTETTGMSGSFTINDKDYKLTGKNKEKYAAYKAQYINQRFDDILKGAEKVTIKDEKTGKYKTVKYNTLNNDEKQRVLKNLYSTGTTITKIQYWLDQGNSYVVTDRKQYYEYKKLFGNSAKIIYRNKWSGSKFAEG